MNPLLIGVTYTACLVATAAATGLAFSAWAGRQHAKVVVDKLEKWK